jgi:hypothetical protein
VCCNTKTVISSSPNATRMVGNSKKNGSQAFKHNQSATRRRHRQSCMLLTVLSTGRLNKSLNRICTGAVSRSITPLPSQHNTCGLGGAWQWAHAKCYYSRFRNEASILNVTFLPPRAFCWCNPLYLVAQCFKHLSHPFASPSSLCSWCFNALPISAMLLNINL